MMREYLHAGSWLFIAALLAGTAAPTWAGGGVVLIGQPKSFPIHITQPGSYKLSENLIVPDANTTVIVIDTDNVTIDLDGFSITGPVVCSGTSCSGSSFYARGIEDPGHSDIVVRNGTIQGMGGHGIAFEGNSLLVENMRIRSNGYGGMLLAGTNAIVRHNNIAQHCGSNAMEIQVDGFLISDNVLTGCGPGHTGAGVSVPILGGAGSVVRNVVSNYQFGLALNANTSYSGNVLNTNNNVLPGSGINLGQNLCGTVACPDAAY
jgi:hypothetical protein